MFHLIYHSFNKMAKYHQTLLTLFVLFAFTQIDGLRIKRETSDFIINGTDVSITRAPFVVQIWICKDYDCVQFCIGTIINKWTVLTAGHCIRKTEHDEYYKIRYAQSEESIGEVFVQTYVHRKFQKTIGYDIAILKTEEPIKQDFDSSLQYAR